MLPKTPGLTLHWGFPKSNNALSPKQLSAAPFLILQLYVFKIGLSVLWHSCLVFYCNWEVQCRITLFVHCQSHHVTYSNILHLSHYSLSPWETVCWILASLLPWYPCVLLCHSFSFALYHFWSLSSLITLFAFWLWFLLNFPVHSSDCCLVYTLLDAGKLLRLAFINFKVCSEIHNFGSGPMRQTCFHSHSSWCREHSEQSKKCNCTLSKVCEY